MRNIRTIGQNKNRTTQVVASWIRLYITLHWRETRMVNCPGGRTRGIKLFSLDEIYAQGETNISPNTAESRFAMRGEKL